MKIICRRCDHAEFIDEAHLAPYRFCPYCGSRKLSFIDEVSGEIVPSREVELLRQVHLSRC